MAQTEQDWGFEIGITLGVLGLVGLVAYWVRSTQAEPDNNATVVAPASPQTQPSIPPPSVPVPSVPSAAPLPGPALNKKISDYSSRLMGYLNLIESREANAKNRLKLEAAGSDYKGYDDAYNIDVLPYTQLKEVINKLRGLVQKQQPFSDFASRWANEVRSYKLWKQKYPRQYQRLDIVQMLTMEADLDSITELLSPWAK